jgi:hypothetical protein
MQNNTHTQKQNIHCCDWELIITRDKTLKKNKIKCRDVVVYDGSKLSVSGCEPCLCMWVCVCISIWEGDRSRMGGTNQFNLIYFSLRVFFFFSNGENNKVVSSQYSSQNKTKNCENLLLEVNVHLFLKNLCLS